MSDYRIIHSDELCHYGVIGMKWGVRRYQNKDGSLNSKGKNKFYDEKGNLNRAGKRAKSEAQKYRQAGKTSTALTVASSGALALIAKNGYKYTRDFIHNSGNVVITSQRINGVSLAKRKATAAMFIAGMGALTIQQINPHVQNIGNNLMYKHDKDYKNRVDGLADMKTKIKR